MNKAQAINLISALYGNDQIVDFRRGVSRKVIVAMNDGYKKYVLKIGTKASLRNSIEGELEKRGFLLPHFAGHLPEITSYSFVNGIEIMKMQYAGDYSFYETVMRSLCPTSVSLGLLSQILNCKKELWLETAKPYVATDCVRDYNARAKELSERICQMIVGGKVISEIQSMPVIVNGCKYPGFGALIERLKKYTPATHTCDSHGDLNADNILLSDDNWFLIDWEWAGRHDWIESLSRICGWWQMMGTTLENVPVAKIANECLELKYDLSLSSLVAKLISSIRKAGEEVADSLQEKSFENKLSYMLATYYLRDLNFQEQRGRCNFTIPAIGEAFKVLFG